MRLNVLAVFLTGFLFTLTKHTVLAKPTHPSEKISDIDALRIEALKQNILASLGYSAPPDVRKFNSSIATKRRKIREFRQFLESKNDMRLIPDSDDEGETSHNKYVYTGTQRLLNISSQYEATVFYNLEEKHPDDPQEELFVKSATLKLFKKISKKQISRRSSRRWIYVTIYKIDKNSNGEYVKGVKLDSKRLDLLQRNWGAFDISKAVQEWLDNPDSNHGVAITSDTHKVTRYITLGGVTFRKSLLEKNISFPVLEANYQQRSILKRSRRQADWIEGRDCADGDGEVRCCRKRTFINFHDIGWNWVVAPVSFEAFFCEGTCPEYYKMAYSFTGIKYLLHQRNPETFSTPCCVPYSLKPLQILHMDENDEYTFSYQQNMIVEDCKCI